MRAIHHHANQARSRAEARAREYVSSPPTFGRDWLLIVMFGTIALAALARVGEDVFAHDSASFDGAVQRWMLAHQQPVVHWLFLAITAVGGILPMCALAVFTAVYVSRKRTRREGVAVVLAPAVALSLFVAVRRIYPRPRPEGLGGIVPSSYSFPSVHATAATAVCSTVAYVLWREGHVRRSTAVWFAILAPLLIGTSRVYLDVHWATDVLGGWSAGMLIAGLAAALYRLRARGPLERRANAESAPGQEGARLHTAQPQQRDRTTE